jgi:ActR/RegA family two-component response regulator
MGNGPGNLGENFAAPHSLVSPDVLLIEPDHAILDRLITPMQTAGFDVVHADEFLDAVALLRVRDFFAVVAAHRLGAHNGLHVLLHARREQPGIIAVVTTPTNDMVLEREAAMVGGMAVVAPWENPGALLQALGSSGVQFA